MFVEDNYTGNSQVDFKSKNGVRYIDPTQSLMQGSELDKIV